MLSGTVRLPRKGYHMLLASTSTTVWLWLMLGFVAYWLPTMIAGLRKVPNLGSVFVVNFFLGWTFIAWVVALAMAVRSVPATLTR